MKTDPHSNYEIRWKNYRRFADTGWVVFKPITVLIGANNSGKSSVLTPLLLLNQTLASADGVAPLVSRGRIVDVGNFRNLVHHHDTTSDVFFGLRLHTHELTPQTRALGEYPPGAAEFTFCSGTDPHRTRLKRFDVFDLYKRPFITRELQEDGTYSLSGYIKLENMHEREQKAVLQTPPMNFLFSPSSTLYEIQDSPDKGLNRQELSPAFQTYLSALSFVWSTIRELFDDLSYIGPLRRRPQRYYRVAGESPITVGAQGENAPNLLRDQYLDLQPALNKWVRRFEFGESVRCNPLGDDLFEVQFATGSEKVNIADAGFGASQVLPLIIQALVAPKDSVTLAEQPEIHLNPRLQGVLADLFVQMANTGHTVVIETHSEHLLLRLRTLIASGEIDSKNVAIYFVERQDSQSEIRPVEIGQDGSIAKETWPRGFFDDALRESLTLATAQSKTKTATSRTKKK